MIKLLDFLKNTRGVISIPPPRWKILLFLFIFSLFLPQTALAQVSCSLRTNPIPTTYYNNNPKNFIGAQDSIEYWLTYNRSEMINFIKQYNIPGLLFLNTNAGGCANTQVGSISSSDINAELDKISTTDTIYLKMNKNAFSPCNWMLEPEGGKNSLKEVGLHYYANGQDHFVCDQEGQYVIEPIKPSCKAVATYNPASGKGGAVDDPTWKVTVSDIVIDTTNPVVLRDYQELVFVVDGSGQWDIYYWTRNNVKIPQPPKDQTVEWLINPKYKTAANHTIEVYNSTALNNQGTLMCVTTFRPAPLGATAVPTITVAPSPTPTPQPAVCAQAACNRTPPDCTLCKSCTICQPTSAPTPVIVIPTLGPLCDQLADKNSKDQKEVNRWGACMKCAKPDPIPSVTVVPGIWTAMGCLPTNYGKLISDYIFTTGMGIAGGIAFLYFLYGAFLILTSAGNPEKIEEAKQIITSALSGVLLIIFSIFLLRVIGVDILRFPGFK